MPLPPDPALNATEELQRLRGEVARLRGDNARLRELLDIAQEFGRLGVWERDARTLEGRWDRHVFRFFGFDEGQTPHFDNAAARIHPDDRLGETFLASLQIPGLHAHRYRVMRPDGTVAFIHSQWRVIAGPDGRAERVVGVLVDDTEIRQLADQADTARTQLELALATTGIGTWRREPASNRIDADQRARNIMGSELLETVHSRMHPWLHEATDEPLDIEVRLVRPDGAVRWIEVRGRQQVTAEGTRQAFGVIIDVTEPREAANALREAHERTMLALSSVDMGTWSHDVATGIDTWDEQMFRLRGLEPGPRALNDDERMAMVLPQDRAQVVAALVPFAHSRAPLAYEFRIRRADGEVRAIASRSIALTDDNGRVVRRIGVNWDVTEARSLEQAQRDRELALRESRAKSALFSRISHELRTPLNAILGFSQLLLAEGDRSDAAQRRIRVQQIQAAGTSLLALVDGVLDLNEQASPTLETRREPLRIGDAVDRALEPLASAIAAQQLRVVRGDLTPMVWADPQRIHRLLAQLLSNAVTFNRLRGELRLHARVEGREAILGVSDTGPGICAERAARLFEAFDGGDAHRAAPRRTLGLAIAQALAKRMGSRIELARTNSEGSLFELHLPLADSPGIESAVGTRPRVLYIEDNEVNMLIVREMVSQRPHIAFHGAADGASGLQAARALEPSLVLIDMQLPDIDGLQVLRRLRADPATSPLTCVALSANAMPEDAEQALAAGFNDYWTKPIELSLFLASLDRLMPAVPTR